MSERIYVAASFEQKEDVKALMERLRETGHTITADWTLHKEMSSIESEVELKSLKREYVIEDTEGVTSATVYVLLLGDRKSTGAHIELGIALGAKIPRICLVGKPDENQLFYNHPAITVYPDVDSFVDSL